MKLASVHSGVSIMLIAACSLFVTSPVAVAHEAPRFHGVPLSCIHSAAQRYGLRSSLLLAILRTEDGRIGTVSPDPNGTDDLGPAQINTCHLPFLEHYGYTFHILADNPCANIAASAWIYARCLHATGNDLQAAACYNAGSEPWIAWQRGYVQRFASFLGLPVHVETKPHPWAMGISVLGDFP